MAGRLSKRNIPMLPVLDLVTGREGTSEDEVTEKDIYNCQIRWDFRKLARLSAERRKELCTLLNKMVQKAPALKDGDSHRLWVKVAKDPEWPDRVMSED